MVIPARDGRRIVVPVHVVDTATLGEVGTCMDIPWFGTTDWKTMYDYPAHRTATGHVPAVELWGLAESRRAVASSQGQVRDAITLFAEVGIDSAKAFLAAPPDAADLDAWEAKLAPIIPEAQGVILQMKEVKPADMSESERRVVGAADALVRAKGSIRDWRRIGERAADMRRRVGGKMVFFGGTATGVGDQKPTSLHPQCPGVVAHGVVFEALMDGHFWRYVPRWVTALITAAVGLSITAAKARYGPWASALIAAAVAGGYALFNALVLFDYGNLIVGLAGPLVTAAGVWGLLTLWSYVTEKTARARITKQFQGYVDPAVVNYLIANPDLRKLEGEVREMTVLFTDLAGYTSLTEKLGAKAVKILSLYKTMMVPAIRRHRGLIHSFMGDGIMVSYGAPIPNPDHAADALNTILDVQQVMRDFNARLAVDGNGPLVTRAGVCTGMAVVGDSGSDEGRDYACLGNTTNLAARLESANKAVGTTMMISGRTAELLGGRFLLRPIAKLTVKGKTVPEMTFEPLALAAEATDAHRRLAGLTTTMFDAYVGGRFADCVAAADAMDAAVGASRLAELYRETAAEYLAAGRPPANFQGQIVLKEK